MRKAKSGNSKLFSPQVDGLLILCEEVTRATPDGAKRFIEPAPSVLSRAKSKQHNIVFGRRGSGKSSLLRKVAADLTVDRRPIAFVDMETFKGHTYPDVLISVLIKALREFSEWLAGAAINPASKTSFWKKLFGTFPTRSPLNKTKVGTLKRDLDSLIANLEIQLGRPDASTEIERSTSERARNTSAGVGLDLAATGVPVSAKTDSSRSDLSRHERESSYVSHKVEYLHQHILKFQRFFRELSEVSGGAAFLVLDDLYHIKRNDQAKVVDYFHRVGKGNDLWLKIGTIKHRSEWYQHSDPPIGMKLGDDAKEINLDVSLETFETLRAFLQKVLQGLLEEIGGLETSDILNSSAMDRLIVASGGVTRDFIGVLAISISKARNRPASDHRGPKVGAEDVNLAAGEYDSFKREEFKLDTAEDREDLEAHFANLVEFCTRLVKCNVFLVSQKLVGPVRTAVEQLIDLRLIHAVKSRVTLKKGAIGEIFEAYMLDLSQYTASRKVHGFSMVDLSSSSRDEDIRREVLVYGAGSVATRKQATKGYASEKIARSVRREK